MIIRLYKLLLSVSIIFLPHLEAVGRITAQATNDAGTKVVALGPEQTQLIGRLAIDVRFGPPNYGEDPKSDKKIKIYVLRMTVPIKSKDASSDKEKEALHEIELFFRERDGATSWDAAHRAVGKCVRVVGEIEPSQLGSEFTPLIMNVDKLLLLKPGAYPKECP